MSARRIIVIGGGEAVRAAAACLPDATVLTAPEVTPWHAEPGLIWCEGGGRIWATCFDALLVCADEPLLLASLGCAFADGRPVIDEHGATSVPGVFAVGSVRGVTTTDEEVARARAAARSLLAGHGPVRMSAASEVAGALRLDPFDLAALLEQPSGAARDAAVLQQVAVLGPVLPARPVGLAALAAFSETRPAAAPPQWDEEGRR